ncbi:MAG: hypothetical protein WCE90_01610 [Candidatus Zixiibacteriota bacterium]
MKNPSTKTAETTIAEVLRKPEYGGLCLTCDHVRSCSYPRNPDQPVWQCEEFEAIDAPVDRTTVESFLAAAHARRESVVAENSKGQFKGLCLNCENRKTCTFPRPEDGVWRCEEYE